MRRSALRAKPLPFRSHLETDMITPRVPRSAGPSKLILSLALGLLPAGSALVNAHGEREGEREPKTLYIWAGDQARKAPDFLAVINFDEDSPDYGKVLRTVPVPPPGNVGNEPHHCHLSA